MSLSVWFNLANTSNLGRGHKFVSKDPVYADADWVASTPAAVVPGTTNVRYAVTLVTYDHDSWAHVAVDLVLTWLAGSQPGDEPLPPSVRLRIGHGDVWTDTTLPIPAGIVGSVGKVVSIPSDPARVRELVTIKTQFAVSNASGNNSDVLPPLSAVPAAVSGALLEYLDHKDMCDVSFVAAVDGEPVAKPIHASRVLLAASSPFFAALLSSRAAGFAEGRALATAAPIALDQWPAAALDLILVHIYSGWVPGSPLPPAAATTLTEREVVTDLAALECGDWQELYKLARMLDLRGLALGANKMMVRALEAEQAALAGVLDSNEDVDGEWVDNDDDEEEVAETGVAGGDNDDDE
ncbi:hypothetical protein BC828DRAFT_400742 [Blastocladiella britannica]|nr:hypothetical protein BC828DRAFT_400742 [Blastocladiella britannica]